MPFMEAGVALESWKSLQIGGFCGDACPLDLCQRAGCSSQSPLLESLEAYGTSLVALAWLHLSRKSSLQSWPEEQYSLFLDFISGSPPNLLRVALSFASMPQVNEGLVYVQNHHGSPGPEAAAVTGHLQQVPFHGHFSPHTVQSPFTCRGQQRHRAMRSQAQGEWPFGLPVCCQNTRCRGAGPVAEDVPSKDSRRSSGVTDRLPKVQFAKQKK